MVCTRCSVGSGSGAGSSGCSGAMATWSGRGQGACPNCSTTYSSRWKPANCPKCGFELGGSAPVAKAQKMCCPPAVNICGALYSIRTSSRDDRCLVYSENNLWICLHSDCKDVRAAYVSKYGGSEVTCRKPDTFLLAATFAASLILLRVLLQLFYHLHCGLKFCRMKKICVYSYLLLLTSSCIDKIESNMWL